MMKKRKQTIPWYKDRIVQTFGAILIIGLLFALLAGCETVGEIQKAPKPQTFKQTVAVAHGQIQSLRDLTAFYLNANSEDCIANPRTDLCAAAFIIDQRTKEYTEQLDLALTAYNMANGVLDVCVIRYGGAEFPCESTQDKILAGLITLRGLLPEGKK